jgi:signal transduction histidine kinase
LRNLTGELVQDLIAEIEPHTPRAGRRGRPCNRNRDCCSSDIAQTADKINQHGQRADRIVAGMLAHSREDPGGARGCVELNQCCWMNTSTWPITASGPKMRAFNVDHRPAVRRPAIETVRIVAQDLSRVFLNIMNNACYAVDKKKRDGQGDGYLPDDLGQQRALRSSAVEIRIRDNGIGIAKDVIEHIFNPFFTTKPTGEGTGLGLSISYDIVVHEHQGDIRVESKEGEFAEFVVTIPTT